MFGKSVTRLLHKAILVLGCVVTPVGAEEMFNCKEARMDGGFEEVQRIVGGESASITQVPWQVALLYAPNGQQFCGGSFISPSWVLTAAHCLKTNFIKGPSTVKIGFGNQNRTQLQTRNVKQLFVHPGYRDAKYGNDIALVQLESRVDFNGSTTAKISIPREGSETARIIDGGTCSSVSGWGVTQEGGKKASDQLQKVALPIVDRASCQASYRKLNPKFSLAEDQFCAGGNGKQDSCQGDSGGPIVIQHPLGGEGNESALVGVVSWGYGCARKDVPGMYTDVRKHYDWIARTIENN